jgi:hypothetical protein
MKRLITGTLIATSIIFTTAASAERVEFPVGQKNGTFHCEASDPTSLLKIDTTSVNINGGCAGSAYVEKPGHLVNVPSTVLTDHYFQIEKNATKRGRVDIKSSNGNVICKMGHGSKKAAFGNGEYCLTAPDLK